MRLKGNFRRFFERSHVVLLAVIVLALYGVILSFKFVHYDDFFFILENDFINGTKKCSVGGFFLPGYVRNDIYIPVTFLAYFSLYSLFGRNPAAFHSLSLVFYMLSVVALYFLLSRMTPVLAGEWRKRVAVLERLFGRNFAAFCVCVLYAVMPVHVECVAWVSAMGYTMAALFSFLSLYFLAGSLGRVEWIRLIASVVLFAAALLSQPASIVMPVVFLLFAFFFCRERLLRAFCISSPFLLLSGLLVCANVAFIPRFSLYAYGDPLAELSAYGRYVFSSLLPFDLRISYDPPELIFLAFLMAAVVFALFSLFVMRSRLCSFCSLGFFAALFPYLGFAFDCKVQDRYLLFPSVFVAVLLAVLLLGLPFVFRRNGILRRKPLLPVACVCLLYSVCLLCHLPVWHDSMSLFRQSYERSNGDAEIGTYYGRECMSAGLYGEAVRLADDALRSAPEEFKGYELKISSLIAAGAYDDAYEICRRARRAVPYKSKTFLFMGEIDFVGGRYDSAERNVREYLKRAAISGESVDKRKVDGVFFDIDYMRVNPEGMLGRLPSLFDSLPERLSSLDGGKGDEAVCSEWLALNVSASPSPGVRGVAKYLHAVRLKSLCGEGAERVFRDCIVMMRRANSLLSEGRVAEAERLWLDALKKDPYMLEPCFRLAFLYDGQGRREEALKYLRLALRCDPSSAAVSEALNKLE